MSHSNNRSLRVPRNTLRHLFPARQRLFFRFLPAFLSLLDIFTVNDCILMLISPISIFSAQSLESVHRSSKCVYEFIGASMGVYNISKEKKIKSKFLKKFYLRRTTPSTVFWSSSHFYYRTPDKS